MKGKLNIRGFAGLVPLLAVFVGGAVASGLVVLDTPPSINKEVVEARQPADSLGFNR